MSPESTSAAPRGLARAEAEDAAAHAADVAARDALRTAQNNKAAQIRLERLARTTPDVRVLLEDYTAVCEALKIFRTKHAELTEAHGSLAKEAATQLEENVRLNERLTAAIADAATHRSRADSAASDAQKLGVDLDAARSETSKVRAELARVQADLEAALRSAPTSPAAEAAPVKAKKS